MCRITLFNIIVKIGFNHYTGSDNLLNQKLSKCNTPDVAKLQILWAPSSIAKAEECWALKSSQPNQRWRILGFAAHQLLDPVFSSPLNSTLLGDTAHMLMSVKLTYSSSLLLFLCTQERKRKLLLLFWDKPHYIWVAGALVMYETSYETLI